MAAPAAPQESGGDKVLFLIDGAGAAAMLKSYAEATVAAVNVGHMGVATAEDDQARSAGQAVVVVGGDDGANLRALAILTDGTLTTHKAGVFAGSGHVNVAAGPTRAALAGSVAIKRVLVRADPGNTAVIYLGSSTVTNDETAGTGGYQLSAGTSVEIEVSNLNLVYIHGTAAEGVSFLYWT